MSATCSAPAPIPTVTRPPLSLSRGGALALSIRVLGAGGMLLCYIVLARALRPAGFSEYAQAVVWLQILCVCGKFGLDNASLRYVSEYIAKGHGGKLRGFVRDSIRISLLISVLVMLGVIATVLFLWDTIGDSRARCLIIASVMIPLTSLRQIQEAGLRGVGQMFESQIGTAIWPLTLFLLAGIVWLGSSTDMSSPQATLLHLVSVGVVSVIVLRYFRRSPLCGGSETIDNTCRHQWADTAVAFFVAELLIVLKGRVCIAMAGAMLDRESVGLYAAMERFADVSLLGSQSLGLVIAPQFASLFAAGRYAEMRRLMWQGQILGLAFTLPVALGVACLGDSLFVLLGSDYRPGWTVLVALLASACIASFAGPAAYVLQMTGRERSMLAITGACATSNVALSFLLMRPLGILGLGVAQVVTSLVWTVGIRLSLRRHPMWQRPTIDRTDLSRGREIEVAR